MIAFLIIILDVDVLRLTLRVVLTVLLLVLYSTLILTTRDQFVLSTLGTATVPFVLFLVAVHGVEHFNHLSDFEKRGLQAQTEQLKNLREHKWELLTDLLPKPIARRILGNAGGDNSSMLQSNMIADVYDGVTVIFTDMKGFTAYSSKLDPSALQHTTRVTAGLSSPARSTTCPRSSTSIPVVSKLSWSTRGSMPRLILKISRIRQRRTTC
jgi:hypothetical protein